MLSSVIVTICAILMLIFLFLKVPVYLAVLAASAVYFVLNPYANPTVFAQQSITGVESISLLAIPFFVCAGIVMNYTGVTSRIMNFCSMLTGRMTGGLAQVNVLLSTLMGGLSGSNLADAAMEAKMMVPEMEKAGFSKSFSTVVTAVSSMITPLIPPGIAMILYGCIANVSIGKLFISGIGVGAILCIAEMILVAVISKKRGYQPMRTKKLTMEEVGKATKPAILPLCLPIIIIGGIRRGGDYLCGDSGNCLQGIKVERCIGDAEGNRYLYRIHYADCICGGSIFLDSHQGTDSPAADGMDDGGHSE